MRTLPVRFPLTAALATAAAALAVSAAARTAPAQGMLIPSERDIPPLAIRSHKVTVDIEAQTSVTKVEQVFENNSDRRIEARFLFPVPKGSALTRFTMMVNGVEKSGEMVEKQQARAIYNSIVQRYQDPGLLEYVGRDLFQANIFPIEPRSTQTITVSFTRVCPRERDLVGYTYPLRNSDKAAPVVRSGYGITVRIKSPEEIKSVYSPTHNVKVERPSENEAKVTWGADSAALDKDFQLFYGVSDKGVGINVVTHRPDKDKPGYFMMLVSPRSKRQAEKIVARDVVFVMDTSGSMAGEKIKQAREALKYCVRSLNEGDRFNIIRFSTDVEPWKEALTPATADARKAAEKYCDSLEAEGGTNIDGALKAAVGHKRDTTEAAARPLVVMFFTDGKPTLGDTTDPKAILAGFDKTVAAIPGAPSVRVFTWGVGFDLDTHLLDRIAETHGGVSEYVKPQEDIASKVAAFYDKASYPVLTDLKLELGDKKVDIVEMYPKKLPDLYAGGQVVVFGRYTGDGAVALTLTGKVNGAEEKFVYESEFAASNTGKGFIEPLWAQRRIGHLLDGIRLHGENKEMIDDVVRLSKQYGIQTPYTSWLVLEDGMSVDQFGQNGATVGRRVLRGRDGAALPPGALPAPAAGGPGVAERGGLRAGAGGGEGREARDAEADRRNEALARKLDEVAATAGKPADARPARPAGDKGEKAGDPASSAAPAAPAEQAKKQAEAKELQKDLAEGFAKGDGKAGVSTALYLNRLKQANQAEDGAAVAFKRAADRRFFVYKGVWVDERYEAEFAMTRVKFGSDAYFALLDKKPELTEAFKIGTALIVVTAPGKALLISDAGDEKLTDAQIEDLFKAVEKAEKK
jgi:Ca-activated chloride channel family protein